MIPPAASRVAIHFSTPQKRELDWATLTDIEHYHSEGHFLAGSMGPKVEAACRFLEGGGKRAIIASLENALPALRGETGTRIIVDPA